ncbi:ATP/GTP-binding protein [Nocardia gipuzkoensis]|uniref:ATP/GTP-binding protein n=1 Tax=Nocardia gipuzkoensis TaxID=2749991 RepID=UPI00237DF833|nr:ATP/GTP-binding protein [Nocardia gipuzkoensis]MDE1672652.1 ATP/GTP-binding protein [Nocardia gipuzkoensis]
MNTTMSLQTLDPAAQTTPARPRRSLMRRLLGIGPRATTSSAAETSGGVVRRPPPKRRRWLDRLGWYEPRPEGAWTTTRQAEGLNLATSRRSVRQEGVAAGLNRISQELEILDPFALYGQEITGINVCLIGDIGRGKSSLIKCAFCLRQLVAGRQVVVLDRKPQSGAGEYTPIARALGAASIRFKTGGGGACVNLLDLAISTGGEHTGGLDGVVPAGQEALVLAVLEDSMGRNLDEREKAAVGAALEIVNTEARAHNRAPVIRELAMRLLDPGSGDSTVFGQRWSDRALEWGLEPGLALLRLADRDLKGLVDSETSPEIRDALEEHPLVHFDLSALPTDGPALRIVMTVINTWLANRLAARSSRFEQTVLIVEEGWHVAQGSTGEVFQANMKLSRGLGMGTVSAFHHISDLPQDSPARALMQEASIVVLFGQDREDDVRATVAMYRLPAGTEEALMRLGRGQALVKIGNRDPFLFEHIRSPHEMVLTDTDTAVKGQAAA